MLKDPSKPAPEASDRLRQEKIPVALGAVDSLAGYLDTDGERGEPDDDVDLFAVCTYTGMCRRTFRHRIGY